MRSQLALARQISNAVAPEPINLSLRDVENVGGGADYRARFTPRTRQATNASETAGIVDHLAQDGEAVVANVQASYSRRRGREYALEREIRVRIEVVVEPR